MDGKLPETDDVSGDSGDLSSFFADVDEILPDQVGEEMVEKVMHELLEEINGPGRGSFPSSSGFVVGESCGPAFSGSGSTVMAGIDMSGGGGGVLVEPIKGVFSGYGPAVGFPSGGANGPGTAEGKGKEKQCNGMQGGGKEEEMMMMMRMDGYDGEDSNDEDEDEWLTMFLNYAPPELDDWL